MFLPESQSRRYTCFVCGIIFEDYDLFQAHIKEKHEEGREYIICPRCEACVRDIPAHFKMFHKSFPIPKMQHRVLVWKDKKNPKKRKTNKFEDGYYLSKKTNKPMHYRSGYEKKVYIALDNLPRVKSFVVEPFKVPYFFANKMRNYHPDLVVEFVDSTITVFEIKPQNQNHLAQNKAKWAACEEFCKTRGWAFKVLNETDIQNMLIESNIN